MQLCTTGMHCRYALPAMAHRQIPTSHATNVPGDGSKISFDLSHYRGFRKNTSPVSSSRLNISKYQGFFGRLTMRMSIIITNISALHPPSSKENPHNSQPKPSRISLLPHRLHMSHSQLLCYRLPTSSMGETTSSGVRPAPANGGRNGSSLSFPWLKAG